METAQQINMFSSIEARFKKFHADNPLVYMLFKLFALQLLQHGHTRIGAKMIIERVRWEFETCSKDDRGYKINNDFIAHYARLFVKEFPQYENCFEFRILKAV